MSKEPSVKLWMPLYIRAHKAAASTLKPVEHSASIYLLMWLWEEGGVVPDDDRLIARNLRLSVPQWRAMKSLLLQDCTIANGQITSEWHVEEVAKAKVNQAQKSKAGKASAAAKAAAKAALLGNGCSTAVETDEPTARQPRAGKGEGEGPFQDRTVVKLGAAK